MEKEFWLVLIMLWILPIFAAQSFDGYKKDKSLFSLVTFIALLEWALVFVGLMVHLLIEFV